MDRSYARVLFTVIFTSQVFGNPTYYWSPQPDCSQVNGYQESQYQQNDYQPNSYQDSGYQQPEYQQNTYQEDNQQTNNERSDYQSQNGYVYEKPTGYQNSITEAYPQVPSYQETLQSMIDETIRALTEIVQITVRASKQELSSLAQMFFDSIPKKFCKSEVETEYDPDDNISGVEQYEEGQGYPRPSTSPARPLKGSLIEQEDLPSSTTSPTPGSSAQPSSSAQSPLTSTASESTTDTLNKTPVLSSSKESTTVSVPSSSTTSSGIQESSQTMLSNEEPHTTTRSMSPLSMTGGSNEMENNLSASNSSASEVPTTAGQQSAVDDSNDNSTQTQKSIPPFMDNSVLSTEVTTTHDSSQMSHTGVDISPLNTNLFQNTTPILSSSINETNLTNGTTPATTESDVTTEQGSLENETLSSTLPVDLINTQITTTYIPTTLSDDVQNLTNMQNIFSGISSLENLQLNTTNTLVPVNNTSNISKSSSSELSNSTANPSNVNEYEQPLDNNVDSDVIEIPRNPKL